MDEVGRHGGEGEALAEALGGDLSARRVEARGDAGSLGSAEDPVDGLLEDVIDGRVGRGRTTDGETEVGRADVEPVDTGGRGDGLDVREALWRLDHGEND